MKLFVEGGGDSKALRTECREGFAQFLKKAGVARYPRIVACGSRESAYHDFCTALANGQPALLLVDSEAPIAAAHQPGDDMAGWKPLAHLARRPGDGWSRPGGADDRQSHLMVQCMETWFLADRQTLRAVFGPGLRGSALPVESRPVEDIDKGKLYQSINGATAKCKTRGSYGKGEHSFKLLALIDPVQLMAASPWAARFVDELKGWALKLRPWS
ncbi:DUF4276 family protein [uncultured Thiodictyon sp.]|uniref:DUF4276 family protein n=1 Tax=uncultured Thiodictyon sp. TaxID=1846217 RepID=UPI0025CD579B|nr:DUF4276 family protein [uncultured Thiodictyon sp.]